MKLLPLAVAVSIAANVACAVVLAFRPALAPVAVRDFLHLTDAASDTRAANKPSPRVDSGAPVRPMSEAAGRAQLWSAIDSRDLKMLVERLRAAGFSPHIIRAVVSARIEAGFAERYREIAAHAGDVPYWKPEPNGLNSNPRFYEEMSQLFRERARVMREIFGSEFFAESAGEASAAQYRQFGDLPKAKIDLIQRINDDYAEMASQVKAAMQGVTLPEDREKLALLEKEKRADLAAILTPEELRNYEMRSSTIATRLRTALGIMDATEDEFNKIYAAHEPLADQLFPVGGVKGAEMSRQRKEAQKQVDDQLALALGPQRAAEFSRAGDYDFQQFYRTAQQEHLPPNSAVQAFDLRSATAKESERIAADKNLDPDAKRAALQALAQGARAQFIALLGANAGAAYAKSAAWLTHIENGGTIRFEGNGTTMFSSPLTSKK